MIKILLATFFLGILIFSGCADSKRTVIIDDPSKEKEQLLRSDREHPFAIRLNATGKTDGAFSIIGINLNGGVIDTSFLLD